MTPYSSLFTIDKSTINPTVIGVLFTNLGGTRPVAVWAPAWRARPSVTCGSTSSATPVAKWGTWMHKTQSLGFSGLLWLEDQRKEGFKLGTSTITAGFSFAMSEYWRVPSGKLT
jgi:hypothetical protein